MFKCVSWGNPAHAGSSQDPVLWRSLVFFPHLPLFLHTLSWLMVPNYVSWWVLISILESAPVPMVYSNPSPETNAPPSFCADFLASSHNFLEDLGKNLLLSSLKSFKSLTIKLVAVVDLRSLFPFRLLARWSLSATQGCSQVVSMWSPPSVKPAMNGPSKSLWLLLPAGENFLLKGSCDYLNSLPILKSTD